MQRLHHPAAAAAEQPLAMRIAVVGAESSGKTLLCSGIASRLQTLGYKVAVVPEVLRSWCARHGRTPQRNEQYAIAQQQATAVEAAAQKHQIVLSDTTALMVAVYSDLLFGDQSLYPVALAQQRLYDATLLTGLDIAWVADGIQRDGPHVRGPVDALIRQALDSASLPFHVVYGSGVARISNALAALENTISSIASYAEQTAAYGPFNGVNKGQVAHTAQAGFVWACDKCGDAACEHRLFSRLVQAESGITEVPSHHPAAPPVR